MLFTAELRCSPCVLSSLGLPTRTCTSAMRSAEPPLVVSAPNCALMVSVFVSCTE